MEPRQSILWMAAWLLLVLPGCVPQAEEPAPAGWAERRQFQDQPQSHRRAQLQHSANSPAVVAARQGPQLVRAMPRRALVTLLGDLALPGQSQAQLEQRWGLPSGAAVRLLGHVGGAVVDLDPAQWQRVEGDEQVAAVTADYAVATQMLPAELVAAVVPGPTGPKQLKLTGAGVAVAVVDTGVDSSHPALVGKVSLQLCFVSGGCGSALDSSGHGTHVASLIASSGIGAPAGIAPGAQLLSLKVLGKGGKGKASDVLAALDWLLANGPGAKVRVVNLSLGSDAVFEGTCNAADPLTAKAIAKLRAKGMAVVAAAGNSASSKGLSAPACLRGAIAVGAVYTADYGTLSFGDLCSDSPAKVGQMTCFSNWSQRLDLTAPGAMLVGARPGAGTAVLAGTSQASPIAAGVAALILQCAPGLTPAKLATLLKATAKLTPAPGKIGSYRLVQALPALAKACPNSLL